MQFMQFYSLLTSHEFIMVAMLKITMKYKRQNLIPITNAIMTRDGLKLNKPGIADSKYLTSGLLDLHFKSDD